MDNLLNLIFEYAEKRIIITIIPININCWEKSGYRFSWEIYDLRNDIEICEAINDPSLIGFISYEEACISAINYCKYLEEK